MARDLIESARILIADLGDEYRIRQRSIDVARQIEHLIPTLPPSACPKVERMVRSTVGRQEGQGLLGASGFRRRGERSTPYAFPDLRLLALFAGDGRIRETAARELAGEPLSPFGVAALAYRLNDWVPQVRRAAATSLERLDPNEQAAELAEAAPWLWQAATEWGRTTDLEPLYRLLDAPPVLAVLRQHWMTRYDSQLARGLRCSLRRPVLDTRLAEMSAEAANPSIRAMSVRVLGWGEVRWRSGWRRQWIDKSMGRWRRVPVVARRELTVPADRVGLLLRGLADPAGPVQSAALDLAMENGLIDAVPRDKMSALAQSAYRPVASRAQYCCRKLGIGT